MADTSTRSAPVIPVGEAGTSSTAASSQEYCPVAIGARLIGDRWSLLIIREMLAGGSRFNEIHRGLPTISRTLLASRLRDLMRDGLIMKSTGSSNTAGYRLTAAGAGLESVIISLGNWVIDWQLPPSPPTSGDPAGVLWHLFRTVDPLALSDGALTIEFRFPGFDPASGWMTFDGRGRGSVCLGPPEQPADLVVTSMPSVLYQLFYGYLTCAEARATGRIALAGTPALESRFSDLFVKSPFAQRISRRAPPSSD